MNYPTTPHKISWISGFPLIPPETPEPPNSSKKLLEPPPLNSYLDSSGSPQIPPEIFCFICRHLQKTGAIEDLVIISEKPLLRGIVRLIAVTGEEAREVRFLRPRPAHIHPILCMIQFNYILFIIDDD